jgi:hypothetical protein
MKYVVHCKREPFDVYIGRGSIWGNPFSHLRESKALFKVNSREEAIEKYTEWLLEQPHLLRKIATLKNKVLGCWCDPLPCHGHILTELANET